jgi:N-acetylmuramoyl-L-alanine amidase
MPAMIRRRALASLAALAPAAHFAGCAVAPPAPPIDTRYTSTGQDSRVLFLILHYTVAPFPLALRALTQGQVSSHYLVSDETPPRVYRLVDEQRRAWHAGRSYWKGHAMLNASSIGIEIVHPGVRDGTDGREYEPFPPAQIDVLIPLIRCIVARHAIRPDRILGHNEVAPEHKRDPGPTFPWKRLADEGLAPWPDPARVAAYRALFDARPRDAAWFQQTLAQHGYRVPLSGEFDPATRDVISVFQMRYRPQRYDGEPDAETAALLNALVAGAED